MIFVDTSVWVAAFRSRAGREADHLTSLLDADAVALAAPVRVEILSGASNEDRPRLRKVLSALPVYFPTMETWKRIDAWIDQAGRAGERFGFADLLIAALSADRGGSIWSLDSDFDRMEKLAFVTCHRP
jgi:predicted nucleic acid-binding protein